MTMLHEQKPSLEEALEHYGVKGMKWGVRRSENELAKARLKKGGAGASKGMGRKAAWNTNRSSGEINKARVAVGKQKKVVTSAAKAAADATPGTKKRAAAEKKLQTETRKLLTSNEYPISAQMTTGEALALAFLGTPMTAVAGWTTTRVNSQRRQNVRSNIILSEQVMKKDYQDLLKKSK